MLLGRVPIWLEKLIFFLFVFLIMLIMILNIKNSAGYDSIHMTAPPHFNSWTTLLSLCHIGLIFLSRKAIFQFLHKTKSAFVLIPFLLISVIMQYLVVKYLNVKLSWDFGILVDQSKSFLQTGKLVSYFVSYPNNIFAVCLLSSFGKIFTPDLHVYQLINIGFITASQYLIFRLGRKVAGKEIGLLSFIVSVFFVPYIFYSPIVYTDTLSLPFLLVPMNIMAGENNQFRLNWVPLLVSSVILSFGVLLKGSLIVFIIALSIVVFLYMEKWKRLLFVVPVLILIITRILFNAWLYDSHILSKSEVDRYSFPVVHWLWMGQNDQSQGTFAPGDFRFTLNNIIKMPRNKLVNLETKEWENRIKRRGITGNIHFFASKLTNTWADGTYYSVNRLGTYPVVPVNFERLTDGKSGIFVQGFARVQHLLLLAGVLIFAVFHRKQETRKNGFFTFSILSLIGFFFFFLLWETLSRYIVSLTPLLIILCSIGYLKDAGKQGNRT